MNKSFIFAVCFYAFFVLSLSGCSKTKETLGLAKKSPDEFRVLKRAPLSMPPDYTLRPPTPGAPRPQEQDTASQAAQTVFGAEPVARATPSDSANLLLQKAGVNEADPEIRNIINSETEELNETKKTVAEKIVGVSGFGSDTPPASIVDAQKEAERLKTNAEEGKPATDGKTPTIEE